MDMDTEDDVTLVSKAVSRSSTATALKKSIARTNHGLRLTQGQRSAIVGGKQPRR
jgi:hypothetical protein